MRQIFIGHDFFGAGNFGDDLMLMGFVNHVQATYPDTQITLCTPHDIASQRLRFPQIAFHSNEPSEREHTLRESDLWLGLGDTPFQCDSGPWSLDHLIRESERCKALGKPMFFLGVGCEGTHAAADPRTRAILEAAERVWTRDELSKRLLQPIARQGVVHEGADLAHLVFKDDAEPSTPEAGVIGLLLAVEHPEQLHVTDIESFIMRREAHQLRWLIQEVRSFPHLEHWNFNALTQAAQANVSFMEIEYHASSINAYFEAFGAPETVVSSRYHTALLAAWKGCKVTVLARSLKLRGIAESLDCPSVEPPFSVDILEKAVAAARSVDRKRLVALRNQARTMCDAFFEETRGKSSVTRELQSLSQVRES